MLYAIFDLDGTLANVDWRKGWAMAARLHTHQSEARAAAWEEFHRRCTDDPPHEIECLLVKLWAQAGHHVIYLTGRTESNRSSTRYWLDRQGMPEGHLFMRPNGSTSMNTAYKLRMLKHINSTILTPQDRIAFIMEDDDRIVDMWRSLGLTCLQPRGSSH